MRTIKAKLLVSLLLLFAAFLLMAGAGWQASRIANNGLETVFNDRVKPLRDLKTVADLYAVNIVDTAHKVRNGNIDWPAGVNAVNEAGGTLKKNWAAYAGTYMDAKEKKLAGEAEQRMQAGDAAVAELLGVLRGRDKAALDAFVVDRLYQAIDPISEAVGKLVELQIEEAEAQYRAAAASYAMAGWAMAGALAVGAAALAFALWIVLRGVVKPLIGLGGAMRKLADHDLSVVPPGLGRNDEVGAMAASVQVFKDGMIEAERLRAEQAEHERRSDDEKRAAMHALAGDFEQAVGGIVETVSSASTELEAAANTLTGTAQTTQSLATTVAAASEQASTNVQSVASASNEMSSSVNEISRQVQESSRIAGEAVKQADKTNMRVTELSQAAQRIGDVVKLITAIAEQTNLLALNATIEAARAGEAGKGFAVVAQEVKALAAQTAKATGDIGAQISGMQTATQESVGAIKEIGGTIGRIAEITAAIAAAVEEQGAATHEIARNVQQAAQGTTMVASSITAVNRGAGETGAASAQVLASAQQLAGESNRLRLEVEKFLRTVRAA